MEKHRDTLKELQSKMDAVENRLRLLQLEYMNQQREIANFLDETTRSEEEIDLMPIPWQKAYHEERERLKQKLEERLSTLTDPELLKRKYAERKVDPKWLFIR